MTINGTPSKPSTPPLKCPACHEEWGLEPIGATWFCKACAKCVVPVPVRSRVDVGGNLIDGP